MRNIAKYPVTFDEKMKLLRRYKTEYEDSGLIGGMDGCVLGLIIEDLEALANLHPEYRDSLYPAANDDGWKAIVDASSRIAD